MNVLKYKFIFPAIGAVVVLLGLFFPTGSLYGKLDFWIVGIGDVDPNILEYLELLYGYTFAFQFLFIMSLGVIIAFLLCICCVFLIIFSYDLKNRKKTLLWWIIYSPVILLGVLAAYIYILLFSIEGFEQGPGTVIMFIGGIISMPSLYSGVRRASFRINEFIVVKLRRGETLIYIAKKLYMICKHLIIDVPFGDINTVDTLDHVIERYGDEKESTFYSHQFEIKPKEIFKGHCSNLQVWVENNYDTRLLSSDLSFPLIRRLSEVGDPQAITVFKEEITKRFKSFYGPVQEFLISEGYLNNFSKSEKLELFKYVIDADLWKVIAEEYLLNSQGEEAIEALEHALEINPINKTILKRLCDVCIIEMDYHRALKYYNTLSRLYKLESDDYLSLGDIYNNLCQINNAKKMYRKASRGRYSSVRRYAFINLALLYLQEKKDNQAMWMYWKAAQSDPFSVSAWVDLSDLFHEKGNIDEAIETLKKGLRFQPSDISLLQCIRELYKINKNYWNYFKSSILYHMSKNRNRKRNRIYKKF